MAEKARKFSTEFKLEALRRMAEATTIFTSFELYSGQCD
jgi:hypothetical protein